jgi:MFS family permease
LRDHLEATASLAAAGFAAFSLMMAAGRLGGSSLADRLGPHALLRASGALAAAGLTSALLLATPWAALVGFGLVGLGVANVIPVLFSAAGRVSGVPTGTALAAIATTGYAGYLAGPPLIGFAAELAGLPSALGIVAACCVVVAAGARVLPVSALGPRLGASSVRSSLNEPRHPPAVAPSVGLVTLREPPESVAGPPQEPMAQRRRPDGGHRSHAGAGSTP